MFNLLKADLYRLFKTKSYYIVGIILALFTILAMYSLKEMIGEGINDHGISTTNPTLVSLIYNVFMNTVVLMTIGIEAAVFICTDYSSGYIKNIASSVTRKSSIALSKFIALTVGIIGYFIFLIIMTFIFGNIFVGNVVLGDVGSLFGYIGMSLFLTLVMVGFVLLTSSIFRNNAASITATVLLILMSGFLYMALKQFLGIDLMDISPTLNYQNLTPENTNMWSTMILSGLGFGGIYLVASAVFMEKKDIS